MFPRIERLGSTTTTKGLPEGYVWACPIRCYPLGGGGGRVISREAVDVVSRWGFAFTKSECSRNLTVSERIVMVAARSPSTPKCSFNYQGFHFSSTSTLQGFLRSRCE